jgi:hypothetical protein
MKLFVKNTHGQLLGDKQYFKERGMSATRPLPSLEEMMKDGPSH